MVQFCVLKHCLNYLSLISATAACPEGDPLTALASVALPERKQVAEEALASERSSELSNAREHKTPNSFVLQNKLAERKKGKKQKHQQDTTATYQMKAVYQ